jgi:hypothetical protein
METLREALRKALREALYRHYREAQGARVLELVTREVNEVIWTGPSS